jgi:hypothetical protein
MQEQEPRWWKAGVAIDEAGGRVTAEAVVEWLKEHSPERVGCSMREASPVASYYRSRSEDRIREALGRMREVLDDGVKWRNLREWERIEVMRRLVREERERAGGGEA